MCSAILKKVLWFTWRRLPMFSFGGMENSTDSLINPDNQPMWFSLFHPVLVFVFIVLYFVLLCFEEGDSFIFTLTSSDRETMLEFFHVKPLVKSHFIGWGVQPSPKTSLVCPFPCLNLPPTSGVVCFFIQSLLALCVRGQSVNQGVSWYFLEGVYQNPKAFAKEFYSLPY